jgi:SAM-dependent methyltransferase
MTMDRDTDPDTAQEMAQEMSLYSRLTHRFLAADRDYLPSYLDAVAAGIGDPGALVVELGCGAEPPAGRALSGSCRVIGVDRHPARLAAASRTAPRARFVTADFRALHFPAGSVDAVVSFYAMIHLPAADLAPMIGRLAGWLRPGGRFAGAIGAACSAFPQHPPPGLTCIPAPQLRATLGDAGLVVLRAETAGWSDPDGSVEFTFFLAARPGAS